MRTTLIALAILAAATPALAQRADPQAVIAAADRNGDGSLDVVEFLAAQRAVMTVADRDGHPGLSLEEFSASLDPSARPNAAAAFTASDSNGNGVLEPDEFAGYQTYIFNNVLDLNHDGAWSVAEFRTLLASVQGAGAAAPADAGPEAAIAALDADHNGAVSRDEYMAFQLGRFAQADTNGNRRLSSAEFRASLDPVAQTRAGASLQAFDANQDNHLSRDEYFAYHAYVFNNVLDTNHDGSWTVEEFRSVMARTR